MREIQSGRLRPTIDDWRKSLRSLSWSPFPGMVPVREETHLRGRDADLRRLIDTVADSAVVVLHGNSGTGKTSLVQAGLVGKLEDQGFPTLICRSWGQLSSESDSDLTLDKPENPHDAALRFLYQKLTEEDTDTQEPERLATSALDLIRENGDEAAGTEALRKMLYETDLIRPAAVVVLDQFEEPLRDYPDAALALLELLSDLVELSRTNTRFVISLRSDSLHLLNPLLLKRINSLNIREVQIDPIQPSFIRDVLRSDYQLKDGGYPELEFDDGLVDLIVGTWEGIETPRLDGLQALLSALYFQARESEPQETKSLTASVATVTAVRESARKYTAELSGKTPNQSALTGVVRPNHGSTAPANLDSELFDDGVKAYVHFMMGFADAATEVSEIDPYLRYGTKEMAARSIEYLWSDGFKVPSDAASLVTRILKPEILMLASTGRDTSNSSGLTEKDTFRRRATELSTELLEADDLLNYSGSERGPEELIDSPRPLDDASTGVPAKNDATAGPLLGRSSERVILEEVRRGVFALTWLFATGLAKRSGPQRARRISLVHDGSGFGLEPWARATVGGFDYDAFRLTAARGERLVFPDPVDAEEQSDQTDGIGWLAVPSGSGGSGESGSGATPKTRVVPNLSWRDCRIIGEFRDIVFLNCDFSGSRFEGCTMRRIMFVNCLLDDANFEDCTIIGSTPGAFAQRSAMEQFAGANVRSAPGFTIGVNQDMAAAFAPYLSESSGGETSNIDGAAIFFSECVGVPAVPGGAPKDLENLSLELPFITGGLAFVGGRISFLTFHSCRSQVDGNPGEGSTLAAPEPATIDFCYAGGGGIDIVEPRGVKYRFLDCAVRGISVTRDQQDESGDVAEIDFSADDSFIVFLYFSSGLSGKANVTNSNVWGAVNSSSTTPDSPSAALKMSMEGSRFQFVVNGENYVDGTEDSTVTGDVTPAYFSAVKNFASVFTADSDRLAHQLELMDFRRSPEVRERQQRARGREESASTQRRDERERGEE